MMTREVRDVHIIRKKCKKYFLLKERAEARIFAVHMGTRSGLALMLCEVWLT